MADPFVAEIRIFPFNFAPKGWAWCDGQLLPLSQNTALFSLLGTTYGGDGKSNFALPGPAGTRADASRPGAGPVAARPGRDRRLGDRDAARVGDAGARARAARLGDAAGSLPPRPARPSRARPAACSLPAAGCQLVAMAPEALAPAGGDQPHNNLQPYLTFYFCIALQGVFPPRGHDGSVPGGPAADAPAGQPRRRAVPGASTPAREPPSWRPCRGPRSRRRRSSRSSSRPRTSTTASTTPTPDSSSFSGRRAVGRLYVARWTGEIRIVDIALLPEFCNRGIGTTLLRQLQAEAQDAGKPLRIHVERFNPALRLYDRLGFRQIEDKGVYLFLEWRPAAP